MHRCVDRCVDRCGSIARLAEDRRRDASEVHLVREVRLLVSLGTMRPRLDRTTACHIIALVSLVICVGPGPSQAQEPTVNDTTDFASLRRQLAGDIERLEAKAQAQRSRVSNFDATLLGHLRFPFRAFGERTFSKTDSRLTNGIRSAQLPT